MLTTAWVHLIEQPSEWLRLHSEPALLPQAIEELLRYSGFPRILFRTASRAVELNGATIQLGDRVALMLASAQRDPGQFEQPDCLDITRQPIQHFALGTGQHACVGAPLIRMALNTLTGVLIEKFSGAALAEAIDWQGGSGFLFPN